MHTTAIMILCCVGTGLGGYSCESSAHAYDTANAATQHEQMEQANYGPVITEPFMRTVQGPGPHMGFGPSENPWLKPWLKPELKPCPITNNAHRMAIDWKAVMEYRQAPDPPIAVWPMVIMLTVLTIFAVLIVACLWLGPSKRKLGMPKPRNRVVSMYTYTLTAGAK